MSIKEPVSCSQCGRYYRADILKDCPACAAKIMVLRSKLKLVLSTTAVFLGGYGTNLSPGSSGILSFTDVDTHFGSDISWSGNNEEISTVQIGGKGEFQTGGGWVGGGFGVGGALKGALFSTMMNAITTKTHFDCIIRLVFPTADVTFQIFDRSPRQLEIETRYLSSIADTNVSRNVVSNKSIVNPIETIREIALLRDQGILTESEFQLKKQELLKLL